MEQKTKSQTKLEPQDAPVDPASVAPAPAEPASASAEPATEPAAAPVAESVAESATEPAVESTTVSIEPATAPVEPAPAAPFVAAGDTVTTGVEQGQPVTVVMKPPKKSKVGLVIAVVVLLLALLGCGGFAVWYLCIYNKPENVAFDAMRQFISAEHVVTTGEIKIYDKNDNGNRNLAVLSLKSSSNNLPNSTTVALNFSERDSDDNIIDNHELSIQLGSTIMVDGVIYLQVGGLVDAFNQALTLTGQTLDDYTGTPLSFFYEVAELIDNEWWQISIPELIEQFSDDEDTAQPLITMYNCIVSAANSRAAFGLSQNYGLHRFVSIAKSDRAASAGHTWYDVTLDYSSLADFINAVPESAGAEEIFVCINAAAEQLGYDETVSVSDINEISADDITALLPKNWSLNFEISNRSHQLNAVSIAVKDGDVDAAASLQFSYEAAEVLLPENYRSVTALIDDLAESFGAFLENMFYPSYYEDFDCDIDDSECINDYDYDYGYDYDYDYSYDDYLDESYDDWDWIDDSADSGAL